MEIVVRGIKIILCVILAILLISIAMIKLGPQKVIRNNKGNINEEAKIAPYGLNEDEIVYNSKDNGNDSNESSIAKTSPNTNSVVSAARKEVLDRAKSMVEVKWTPKYNLTDQYGPYTFVKGKTYNGIPYSMDSYQVRAVSDFLTKIDGSRIIYGNDCSGFVSAAWGLGRQTTLDFYQAAKNGNKIDGKTISEISWQDLKPGDAMLLDNGKGKGHIMLFVSVDGKDHDKLNVYEQNVPTIVPFEPLPVARKDVRSMSTLKTEGYFPIRLTSLE